ncbi:DUF742 domain-containing protein [Marinitenerispora sediminis]|uniref:DUF742 domain-containing protein n=1 Tax=Marinitenerispora sediminis TaxID=1931232 RepID=A0A368T075_9ACTN|nr:DUF742 domain-containing protein [Marinitenerispora sediminis]RCV49934.1 hypothetical protein DEF23_22895 [Marinitenerispora sediminis]RCV52414.1 hypothetical protein DEF24_22010 [Marinitenerispora sediminis]RCV53038.1 hypothetical protein DEF28_11445 [Marinitenerispora sediminis]
MTGDDAFDADPGRLVRPFAVAVAGADDAGLDMLSLVVATRAPDETDHLRPEHEAALGWCDRPRTIVELAARLQLPLNVVKLLVAGMIADGAMRHCRPAVSGAAVGEDVLRAVLDGLRAL